LLKFSFIFKTYVGLKSSKRYDIVVKNAVAAFLRTGSKILSWLADLQCMIFIPSSQKLLWMKFGVGFDYKTSQTHFLLAMASSGAPWKTVFWSENKNRNVFNFSVLVFAVLSSSFGTNKCTVTKLLVIAAVIQSVLH